MIIYNHGHKDRTVIELEEKEFTLIAYLIEKSAQNLKGKMNESLSDQMNKEILKFESENKKDNDYIS
ncbi:MAG: hypothetical protein ACSHXA_07435 [Polaribacter sp.]|uniref:hypothetical protein n=1 Tax=Polaribacter sp. TaxID=1920175 RepID=UPI003EF8272F